MHGWKDVFKVEYNDAHKFASKLRGFLLLCESTRSAIYGSQKFDYHKWPNVLVDEVKGNPCNFEAYLCRSLYSIATTSFFPYAFYNKRLQMLFEDQIDRSRATCSFKF